MNATGIRLLLALSLSGMLTACSPAATPTHKYRLLTHPEISQVLSAPEFSPDGRQLAVGGQKPKTNQDEIVLWDTATGVSSDLPLDTTVGELVVIRYSPARGSTLLVTGSKGGICIWDTKTHRLVRQIGEGNIFSLAFSPDGRLLASTSEYEFNKYRISLWDTASWESVGEPILLSTSVYSLAFSPDGQTLMSADMDGYLTFWHVATQKVVGQPFYLDMCYGECWFSPDGRQLFGTSYADGVSRLLAWDLGVQPPKSQVIVTIDEPTTDLGAGFAFNFDRMLFAWERGEPSTGGVVVLDLKTQRRLEIDLAGNRHAISFSPNGQILAVTNNSGDGPVTGICLYNVGNP